MEELDTNVPTRKRWWSWLYINKEMVPCKLTYLLFGGVVGSYAPYLPMFLNSLGLTPAQAGFTIGLEFVVSSLANPLWGYFADRTGKRKLILLLLCLGSALLLTPIPWVALFIHQHYQNNNTTTTTTTTTEICNDVTDPEACTSTLRLVLTTLILLGALFYCPLSGYLDTIAANVIKHSRSKANYGSQRICGSIGSAMTCYVVGLAADHFNVGNLSPYTPAFLYYFCVALLIMPIAGRSIDKTNFSESSQVEDQENRENQEPADTDEGQKEKEGEGVFTLLVGMLRIPDNVIFLCTVLVSGTAFIIYVYFTLLLMKDEFQNTRAMMSLALVVECASNLIVFPLSATIIRLLRGPMQAVIFALATYSLRFLTMSYTKTFAVMIAVQALNGLSFALGWCAFIDVAHRIAPKPITVTVFMLLSSIHFGVCGLVGNILGGYVFHVYGGRMLFRWLGILCGVWAIFLTLYYTVSSFSHKLFPSRTIGNKEGNDVDESRVDNSAKNGDNCGMGVDNSGCEL